MKRYKVMDYGGFDGLHFPDLLIKYSNGYSTALLVKQGNYIPIEILDPLDVKKSLFSGSLKAYLASGSIIEEDSTSEIPAVSTSKEKSEKEEPTQSIETTLKTSDREKENPVEVINTTPLPMPIIPPPPQPTSLHDVSSIEVFNTLPYFQKLSFIQQTQNFDLLKQIQNTTSVQQFKNNIEVRLSNIL